MSDEPRFRILGWRSIAALSFAAAPCAAQPAGTIASLQAEHDLAESRKDHGPALAAMQRLLPLLTAERGAESVSVADARADIAYHLLSTGRFAEAEHAAQVAAELYSRLPGPGPRQGRVRAVQIVGGARSVRAAQLGEAGRFEESEILFRDAISLLDSLAEPARSAIARQGLGLMLVNHGIKLSNEGAFERADARFDESIRQLQAAGHDDREDFARIRLAAISNLTNAWSARRGAAPGAAAGLDKAIALGAAVAAEDIRKDLELREASLAARVMLAVALAERGSYELADAQLDRARAAWQVYRAPSDFPDRIAQAVQLIERMKRPKPPPGKARR